MINIFNDRRSTKEEEAAYISNLSKLALIFFIIGKIQSLLTAACIFMPISNVIKVTMLSLTAFFIASSALMAYIDNKRFEKEYIPSKKMMYKWAKELGLEIKNE